MQEVIEQVMRAYGMMVNRTPEEDQAARSYRVDISIARIGDRSRQISGARSLRCRPARFTDLEPAKKIAA